MRLILGVVLGVVLTLLAVVLVPVFLNGGSHHRCYNCRTAMVDIRTLTTAVALYGLDNRAYPTTNVGLNNIVAADYLRRLPKDPWGYKYHYSRYDAQKYSCFSIWSFGSDGVPGGEEDHEKDFYSSDGKCITNQATGTR
ncbi:type II secretion system protein GspG [uncultured Microbulbifer sp.]|uniref:type II secretion system protein GspG n=1 Tax=uncultured Microbulbifer sp. TaxID=348147 RepID=UPI00344D986C